MNNQKNEKKNIKVSKKHHDMLKMYCDKNGLKIYKLIEKYIDIVELISEDNNYKEIFQTHCQKTFGYIPFYKDIEETGVGIYKVYKVAVCGPGGKIFATATGNTKQAAQKEACRIALESV